LDAQPIAAEDWAVIVVWLGCGFSGRHREPASDIRDFLVDLLTFRFQPLKCKFQ